MTYPFVSAANDYGPRKGPILGLTIHCAEGGGTVGYLDRVPPLPARGVSVHYVIEYGGRIVQMLPESHASGSINPTDIRTTDDADGFFGVTAARAVLGTWWKDPNSAVLSVEIEGFAISGPNAKQQAALIALVDDLRTRYPSIGLLGHRDHQDYKPCPGRLIPWTALGGHGPATGDDLNTIITILPFGGTFTIPTSAVAFEFDASTGAIGAKTTLTPADHPLVNYDAIVATTATRGNPFVRIADGAYKGRLVASAEVVEQLNPAPDENAIRASQAEEDRNAAIAAVKVAIP